MFAPLVIGGKTFGHISLQNLDRTNAFSAADVRLLTTLAGSLSVALENARLFDETQRLLTETNERAAELAIINSVQQGLAAKLDMQSMYELVGDKIQEIFDAQVVDIGIYDFDDRDTIHYPYTIERGVRFPESDADHWSQRAHRRSKPGRRCYSTTSRRGSGRPAAVRSSQWRSQPNRCCSLRLSSGQIVRADLAPER